MAREVEPVAVGCPFAEFVRPCAGPTRWETQSRCRCSLVLIDVIRPSNRVQSRSHQCPTQQRSDKGANSSMSSPCFPPPERHDSHAKDPFPDGSHSHGYTRSTIEMPSIICGLDGRVVWANDAWVRLSGFSRVEILAYDHLVQLHGPRTDPVAVRALMQQVAMSQESAFVWHSVLALMRR